MNSFGKNIFLTCLKICFFITIYLSSCTIVKDVQPNKPFVFDNKIEIKQGKFKKEEKTNLKIRLNGQLDDSVRVTSRTSLFLWKIIESPPAYDSGYAAVSANNIRASLVHLGYYKAEVSFEADTSIRKARVIPSFRFAKGKFPLYISKEKRVSITYNVKVNTPTLIDTVSYRLKKEELQQLALASRSKSYLKENEPISKGNVLSEIGRLVDTFQNNGYYKFTADNLRVRGDTTLEILTSVSDDPFENLRLLAEANEKRNKPTIKLAVVLNNVSDTNKLKKYYIDSVIIYPDYTLANITNPNLKPAEVNTKKGFTIRSYEKMFRTRVISGNMALLKGDLYRQENYYRTINNLTRTGLWQSVNVQMVEHDTSNKLNAIIQLLPAKKLGFEAGLEASYSANSNVNNAVVVSSTNWLGLAANVSLQNRNFGKKGIKMTHALRGGIELNIAGVDKTQLLNATEITYTNTVSFPRLIWPYYDSTNQKKYVSPQSFITTNIGYVNRIELFSLQNFGTSLGYNLSKKSNRLIIFKPLNVEFSYLYNESDSFKQTLKDNPYLNYSFNTALVTGLSVGYNATWLNPRSSRKQHYFRANLEESGLILDQLNAFQRYLKTFVKTDVEYRYQVYSNKSFTIYRAFLGVGAPIGKDEASLPFFKQYFAGGSNSMRGWPIRGIGRGAQKPIAYDSLTFNDRTGDIKIEGNFEYQYNILQIIPNSLTLKGALFIDAGNVWNFKNSNPNGGYDSLQFNLNKLYQQLGVSAGTGFRFDFKYFLIRFDLAFRFKKPDVAENDGWQLPGVSFNRLFRKGGSYYDPTTGKTTNDAYQRWRYENFNFTIGIGLPFQ